MILINLIYGLSLEITESTFSSGNLKVTSTNTGIVRLSFPKLLYPYLYNQKDKIVFLEENQSHLNIYMYIKDEVNIKYSKVILNTNEYGWKIERGIIIPKAILHDGTNIRCSNTLVDVIYVPDFTVPFLAFNTCGAVYTIIFSIFVKKRFNTMNK